MKYKLNSKKISEENKMEPKIDLDKFKWATEKKQKYYKSMTEGRDKLIEYTKGKKGIIAISFNSEEDYGKGKYNIVMYNEESDKYKFVYNNLEEKFQVLMDNYDPMEDVFVFFEFPVGEVIMAEPLFISVNPKKYGKQLKHVKKVCQKG